MSGKTNDWKGIFFNMASTGAKNAYKLGGNIFHLENYAFPEVYFSYVFSMLFSITNSRRIH